MVPIFLVKSWLFVVFLVAGKPLTSHHCSLTFIYKFLWNKKKAELGKSHWLGCKLKQKCFFFFLLSFRIVLMLTHPALCLWLRSGAQMSMPCISLFILESFVWLLSSEFIRWYLFYTVLCMLYCNVVLHFYNLLTSLLTTLRGYHCA